MFRVNVRRVHALSLFAGVLEYQLRFRRERHVHGRRRRRLQPASSFDLPANQLVGKLVSFEDLAGDSRPLTQQSQQQVLGVDRRAGEGRGVVTSEEDDPAGSICVSLEHGRSATPSEKRSGSVPYRPYAES